MRLREVPSESCTRIWIDINAQNDFHSGCLQAGTRSAASGKEIKNPNFHSRL
jgi:hypothetical protein